MYWGRAWRGLQHRLLFCGSSDGTCSRFIGVHRDTHEDHSPRKGVQKCTLDVRLAAVQAINCKLVKVPPCPTVYTLAIIEANVMQTWGKTKE